MCGNSFASHRLMLNAILFVLLLSYANDSSMIRSIFSIEKILRIIELTVNRYACSWGQSFCCMDGKLIMKWAVKRAI